MDWVKKGLRLIGILCCSRSSRLVESNLGFCIRDDLSLTTE